VPAFPPYENVMRIARERLSFCRAEIVVGKLRVGATLSNSALTISIGMPEMLAVSLSIDVRVAGASASRTELHDGGLVACRVDRFRDDDASGSPHPRVTVSFHGWTVLPSPQRVATNKSKSLPVSSSPIG
jgi:hypothetical protein